MEGVPHTLGALVCPHGPRCCAAAGGVALANGCPAAGVAAAAGFAIVEWRWSGGGPRRVLCYSAPLRAVSS